MYRRNMNRFTVTEPLHTRYVLKGMLNLMHVKNEDKTGGGGETPEHGLARKPLGGIPVSY